jgi:hypothetical protein
MSGQPIFIRVDRDGVHRELVGRTEDADGDFLEKIFYHASRLVMKSYSSVCDKDLCQGPAVTSRLASHGLDGVHGRARHTGCGDKDGCEPGGVKGRHGWGPMRNRSRIASDGLYMRLGGGAVRKPDRKELWEKNK